MTTPLTLSNAQRPVGKPGLPTHELRRQCAGEYGDGGVLKEESLDNWAAKLSY